MALTGDGDAYYQRAPQDATTPMVIFSKQSGDRVLAFAGNDVKPQVWLVKAVSREDSASAAEDIDARVETVLNGATLIITGHNHLYLRRESDVTYPEDDGAETYQHVGALYRIVVEAT